MMNMQTKMQVADDLTYLTGYLWSFSPTQSFLAGPAIYASQLSDGLDWLKSHGAIKGYHNQHWLAGRSTKRRFNNAEPVAIECTDIDVAKLHELNRAGMHSPALARMPFVGYKIADMERTGAPKLLRELTGRLFDDGYGFLSTSVEWNDALQKDLLHIFIKLQSDGIIKYNKIYPGRDDSTTVYCITDYDEEKLQDLVNAARNAEDKTNGTRLNKDGANPTYKC